MVHYSVEPRQTLSSTYVSKDGQSAEAFVRALRAIEIRTKLQIGRQETEVVFQQEVGFRNAQSMRMAAQAKYAQSLVS